MRVARQQLFVPAIITASLLVPVGPARANLPPLTAYGDLPAIEDVAISLSGDHIATLATVNAKRAIIILDSELNPISSVATGETKPRSIEWVGDEAVVVRTTSSQTLPAKFYSSMMEMSHAMVIYGGTTPKVATLFERKQNFLHATFGRYGSRFLDGQWRMFVGGVELDRQYDGTFELLDGRPGLYSLDLTSLNPKRVAPATEQDGYRSWLVGPDGSVAATFDFLNNTQTWTIRNQTGKTIAQGSAPNGNVGLVSLGATGQSAIFSTENDTSDTVWMEVPLSGASAPHEVFSDIAIARIYSDRTTGAMIGYRNMQTSKDVFFDPKSQSIANSVSATFGRRHTVLVDWTPNLSKVIVRTDGPGDSGSLYVVDIGRGSAQAIGYERPAIEPEMVGPVKNIDYKAGDGLELDGILTLPPGREAKGLPVIMLPHGGPHTHDIVSFDWWAQAFASRGYAVFQPNFRGSTNRDDVFERASENEWGGKMQSDISDGLAALAAQGIVDPKRACIMGGSYGGYAALAGVTLEQGLYRCSVAVAAVSDINDLIQTSLREDRHNPVTKAWVSREFGNRSRLDAISPRKQAARADAPVMLIHGTKDTVVEFSQSRKMADALRAAGKPVELVTLKEEDHWLSLPTTRNQMLEAAMGFVLRHNPPD